MNDRPANTSTDSERQALLSLIDSLLDCVFEHRPADNELLSKYREIRGEPPYIDMSSLTYEDVEQLFDIHRVHQGIMQTWCEPECVTTFPTAWRDVLLEMQLEVQNTIPMNLLLFYARKMAQEILNPESDSESDLQSNTGREIFRIKTENHFLFKGVICKGKSHNIFGQPDYVLCVGDSERSLKCILVVVESKTLDHRPDRNDARYQLLCYMGMVHKARRDAGKPDCRVWGVATIGNQFHFLHITHSGDWAPFLVDLSARMDSEGLNKILAILTAMIVDGAKQTNVYAPRHDERRAFRSRYR